MSKSIHAAAGESSTESSMEDNTYILCDYLGHLYDDPKSSFDWKDVTCRKCKAAMTEKAYW